MESSKVLILVEWAILLGVILRFLELMVVLCIPLMEVVLEGPSMVAVRRLIKATLQCQASFLIK